MTIVACLKWVSRPDEPHDERYAGMSAADQSALEFALRQGELLGAVAQTIERLLLGLLRVLQLIAGEVVAGLSHRLERIAQPVGHRHAILAETLDDLVQLVA